MSELWQVARLIRSKNAGPFELTVDVICDTPGAFERVRRSGIMTQGTIAQLFGVAPADVRIFEHEAALALKASIRRPHPSGDVEDTDMFGGQFHSPLVRALVPEL
jgi:hypothetical protein